MNETPHRFAAPKAAGVAPLPSAPVSDVARYAWMAVLLLWPVALLNYLDRQMLGAMKVSVMHDLPGIGLEQHWGLLFGAFKWVYAALSLPLEVTLPTGSVVVSSLSESLFVWSVVTWATGHAALFYEQLLAARALMGVSEAFYIPRCFGPDHRPPHRSHPLTRCWDSPNGHLYRRHRRRLCRLRGGCPRPWLAIRL